MTDAPSSRVDFVLKTLVEVCTPLWQDLDAKGADMAAARVWVQRAREAHRNHAQAILDALDATLDPDRPSPCVTCTPPFRETEGGVCQGCGTDYARTSSPPATPDHTPPSMFEAALESFLATKMHVRVDRPGQPVSDDDPLVVGDIVRVAYPVPPGVSNLGEVVVAERGGHVVRVRFSDRLHEHDARELLRLVRAERRRGYTA